MWTYADADSNTKPPRCYFSYDSGTFLNVVFPASCVRTPTNMYFRLASQRVELTEAEGRAPTELSG